MPFVPLDQTQAVESPRGFVPLAEEPERGFVPLAEQPRGFVPLDQTQAVEQPRGFVPLDIEPQQSPPERQTPIANTLKAVNQIYPQFSAAEAAANLGSQAVGLPVAGLAGLGAAATKAVGLTDAEPGDVVRSVGEALTYQPRTDQGKAMTGVISYPFEKLAEAGQYVGGKTLDATGSPLAATAVDTAVNSLPMFISPLKKGAMSIKERIVGKAEPVRAAPVAESSGGFTPLESPENAGRLAASGAEGANDLGGMSNSGPTPEAYPKGRAMMLAGRMTREGTPSEIYPHPAGDGSFAIRPIGDRLFERPQETLDGRTDTSREIPDRVPGVVGNEEKMQQPLSPIVEDARESGNNLQSGTGDLRGVSGERWAKAQSEPLAFSERPEPGIYRDQYPLDAGDRSTPETVREGARNLDEHDGALYQSEAPEMGAVRRDGNYSRPRAGEFRELSEERRYQTQPGSSLLAERQASGLQPQKRGMGIEQAPDTATGQSRIVVGDPVTGRGVELDPTAGPLSKAASIGVETGVVRNLVRDASPETLNASAPVHNAFAPGNAYTGFVSDVPQAKASTSPMSVVGRDKPIRREDILIPFARDLGASLYEGRVKGKNRLGFFRPKLEETRIKRHADIEVAAHELAHLIDDRVPAIKAAWLKDKVLASELRSISYDATKVNEGWAEGVRLWMTQPETLQAKAPRVFNWLERFATTDQRYGPAMKRAQDGMIRWFDQDALDRARSKIGDHAPLSDAMNGIFDRFRQSVSDDLHGIYRFERELSGGKLEPVGAYETARLSRASASIADGAIQFGYPVKNADGSFSYRGKGLQEIMKPAAERLDDALLYFVGRSARELMVQGREHLFSQGEIKGMLALETPEFRKAFAEYQVWNRKILDFAEAQGVLNPETRVLWKRTEYLPFHRVSQPGGMKGKPGQWQGIQQLTGGTENIKDVLGNMIGNAAQLIDLAVKNEARQKVAQLANRPGGGRFMAKIDPGSRPIKVGGNQVLDAMFKKYGIAIDGEAPQFFEFMQGGQPPAGGNVVAVLKGGKPVWYEVADPLLYRALSAIDRPPMNWVVNWLGLPKRIGQASITLDPSFIAGNFARDQVMSGVMTRSGFRPVIDAMKGLQSRLAEDLTYREWVANGGGLSSLFLDEGQLRKHMDRFYVDRGINLKTVLDAPGTALYFVERMGDAIESSSRIGEFSQAIASGEHPRHAAYLSRELSVDWSMKGDSKALGVAFDTVMFLRAAVVSMDRVVRGVAHDPNRGAIAAKAGLIGLASAALYLLNRGDPRYDDMDDWKKDAFWHVFVGSEHFMLPKSFEVGAIGSLAERTIERTLDHDPEGLGKDVVRVISNVFGLNWKPQIISPLYDQATNSQGVTKARIETPGMENLQPFLRSKPTTSETFKGLGMATRNLPESMQVNPVRAEALLKGYFNSWATYGLMATDAVFFGGQKPSMRADEMPVVRRFYAQEPPKNTKFDGLFYDMLSESQRLHGTLLELDRQGRPEIADEKERSPMATEAKPLERAAKNLSAIQKDMMAVHRSQATPEEKRQKLDALIVERNALLKATVMDAKAAQRK